MSTTTTPIETPIENRNSKIENPPSPNPQLPVTNYQSPSSPPSPFPFYPGELNLIVGRPGIGKSLLALDLAARASQGTLPRHYLPDTEADADPETLRAEAYQPGNALVLSLENQYIDLHLHSFGIHPDAGTLPSRDDRSMNPFHNDSYEKHGGRYYNDAPFLQWLRDRERAGTRILVLDPLPSFLGPMNTAAYSLIEMLEPLLDYAVEHHMFIIGISHLVKTPRRREPVHHIMGSLGYSALARCVLLLTHDEHPPKGADPINRRLLIPIKNNCAAIDAAYAFTFQSRPPLQPPVPPPQVSPLPEDPTLEQIAQYEAAHRAHQLYRQHRTIYDHHRRHHTPLPPQLHWDPAPLLRHPQLPALQIAASADALGSDNPTDPINQTLFLRAKAFLRDILKDGPVPSSTVFSLGHQQGLSKRTLERARADLEIPWSILPNATPTTRYVLSLPQPTLTPAPAPA